MNTYSEASWENYAVLYYISNVQSSLKQFDEQARTLNKMVAADTTIFGRKTPGYPQEVLPQKDAAYNAVLATDKFREQGLATVGGDEAKAYTLASTKMYLNQVETYLATFGKDPKNEDAALLAYNAAIIHYNAKQYKTSVRVLSQLKSVYPTHKYIKEIRLSLANSYVFADMLVEGEKEYESVLKLYVPTDSMYPVVEQSIAAVQFQQAEKYFKAKQFKQAAKSYSALQKRFPKADFADQALFRVGESYEGLKQTKKAVKVLLSISELYPKSKFKISSIFRAGKIYKEAGKPVLAAQTFLMVTERFPKDSAAFTAIGVAASTYDSIPDKKTAAETFKLAHLKYPGHTETPSYVYNACLLYEEIKMVDEAIGCNKLIVSNYPKSSYALDAAWSIGVAYEKGERWAEAAKAYLGFIKKLIRK
jgi:TolA-binding protein